MPGSLSAGGRRSIGRRANRTRSGDTRMTPGAVGRNWSAFAFLLIASALTSPLSSAQRFCA